MSRNSNACAGCSAPLETSVTTSYTYDLTSNRKSVKPTDDQMITCDSHVYVNQ
jgi:hypothetical protein